MLINDTKMNCKIQVTFQGIMIKITNYKSSTAWLLMIIDICDQICKKGSYTRTTSIHRFCHHSIATLMNNPCMFE